MPIMLRHVRGGHLACFPTVEIIQFPAGMEARCQPA